MQATGKPKKGVVFLSKEDGDSQDASKAPEVKKVKHRHTGYAFDHPGFESFYANEARSSKISFFMGGLARRKPSKISALTDLLNAPGTHHKEVDFSTYFASDWESKQVEPASTPG